MVVVGAGGALYYVTHLQEVPYTHRRHAIFVSPQTEIALGLATYAQVLCSPAACIQCAASAWGVTSYTGRGCARR
jgi:hypothetical protein